MFFTWPKLGANEINPLLQRGEGEASPLLVDGRRRDILTAFQRYRNSRLSADFQTEITDRSLAECLDECLRQVSIVCQDYFIPERNRKFLLKIDKLPMPVDDVQRALQSLSA